MNTNWQELQRQTWKAFIAELLICKLQEQGIEVEVREFDANALHAYYSAVQIKPDEEVKYSLNYLGQIYFEPMILCVIRGALQEKWTKVIVQVSVDEKNLVVIDLVETDNA
jgi:hypothetical protein